jgi:hypothetical protein
MEETPMKEAIFKPEEDEQKMLAQSTKRRET